MVYGYTRYEWIQIKEGLIKEKWMIWNIAIWFYGISNNHNQLTEDQMQLCSE